MYNIHPEFLDKLKSMFKEHKEEMLGNDQKPSGNSQKVSGNIAVNNIEKSMDDNKTNNLSYKDQSTAPTNDRDGSSPLHNLNGTFPADIYSNKAKRFYGHGNDKMDDYSVKIIHSTKDKPEATVRMYRAVPKHVKRINEGDWVSINPHYAKMHGESRLGNGNYRVLYRDVKAKHLYNNGDIHEWGYSPNNKSNIEKSMGDDFRNLGKVGLATLGLIHGAQSFTNQAKEPALQAPQQVESVNPYKEETAKVKNETMGDYLYNRHGMNHNQILGIVKTNPKLSSQYSYVQSLKPESIKDLMQHNKDFKNEVVRNHYSNLSSKTNGDFDKINLLWKHSNRIK